MAPFKPVIPNIRCLNRLAYIFVGYKLTGDIIFHTFWTTKSRFMSFDLLFTYASNLAMLGWVLLIFVPYWKYTRPIVQYALIPIVLSILYAYLVFFAPGGSMDLSSFGSLEGVMGLFTDPKSVLAGWVHYLAFDLWVGSWEVGDAKKRGINRWLLVPCLLGTFMLGPVGLLLYLILRAVMTKKVDHENF